MLEDERSRFLLEWVQEEPNSRYQQPTKACITQEWNPHPVMNILLINNPNGHFSVSGMNYEFLLPQEWPTFSFRNHHCIFIFLLGIGQEKLCQGRKKK
ncbi:hypothetical protein CEXT_645201 [Caerostris extrusa]|uniref:Ycf15 n=1 Tax=Caerostris extrusa TaxID=172846 RepID=A0AAV4WPX5_CAEEX|nr:hypothetical protein CEXT_645201 [Caerostris extrusa]